MVAPRAARVEVRREQRARRARPARAAGSPAAARSCSACGEVRVEERLERLALGRVGVRPRARRGGSRADGTPSRSSRVGRLEARRVEHQQLVELADEVAHHVADADVLALAHQRGGDVVERDAAVEQLQEAERLDAQHRLARDHAERVAHQQQLAPLVARSGISMSGRRRGYSGRSSAARRARRRAGARCAGASGGRGLGAGQDDAPGAGRVLRVVRRHGIPGWESRAARAGFEAASLTRRGRPAWKVGGAAGLRLR